jgi:hypothetical protein
MLLIFLPRIYMLLTERHGWYHILMNRVWACGILEFCYVFRSRQAYMFPVFLCAYKLYGGPMSLIKGFISKVISNGRDVLVIHNSWGKTSYTEPSYHIFITRATSVCASLHLLRGFVTVNFSGVVSLVPRSTPKLEGQGRQFVWSLSLICLACVVLQGV